MAKFSEDEFSKEMCLQIEKVKDQLNKDIINFNGNIKNIFCDYKLYKFEGYWALSWKNNLYVLIYPSSNISEKNVYSLFFSSKKETISKFYQRCELKNLTNDIVDIITKKYVPIKYFAD